MTEVLLPALATPSDSPFNHPTQDMHNRLNLGGASKDDFALHRAAFDGTSERAWEIMNGMSKEDLTAFDPQGNTALHVAVLRKRPAMVLALLDAGFPVTAKNAHQWSALEDAAALKDKELVKILHTREISSLKAELKAKKESLLTSLNEIPDCTFQVKWELRSPVLGMLLRKYAPSDTYEVWKRGSKMRVDGSMMGLDVKRTGILPVWKKGHFSLICDGSKTPATMLLCDHTKKKYWDLYAEKKRHRPTLDEEASLIISEGAQRTKVRATEKYFKPVKSWFGYETTEKIEGWRTKVYEAAGKMMAVTITKKRFDVPEKATWEDYLALAFPEDLVKEEPVDLTSMDLMSGKNPMPIGDVDEDEEAKKKKQPRKITAKCWMAENFPMSLKNLLPVLEVIGNANKHLARVGNFLQKYGNKDLFPVKLQMPLFYTIYALVSFSRFNHMTDENKEVTSDAWFELPPGYELREFNDAHQKRRSRSMSLDGSEVVRPSLEVQGSDAEILQQMGL